jgi:hypothetical protein
MKNLLRPILLVALILFFLVPSISKAAETYPVQLKYWCQNSSGQNLPKPARCDTGPEGKATGQLGAEHYIAGVNAMTGDYKPAGIPWTLNSISGTCGGYPGGRSYSTATCSLSFTRSDGYTGSYTLANYWHCPYGGTQSGSSCIDAPDTEYGRDPNTGQPNPPPPQTCIAGPTEYTGHQYTFDGEPTQGCFAGCIHTLTKVLAVGTSTGWITSATAGNATGGTCDMTPTAPEAIPEQEQTPEEKCVAQGLSYGYLNGEVKCYQPGEPNSAPTTKTEGQTKTESTSSGNTTTTIETTINTTNNAVITTTVTTVNNNGTVSTTSETSEQSKDVYCQENPSADICKDIVIGEIGGAGMPSGSNAFYQSSYPDGISGVWSNFQSSVDQSSFVSAMHSMAPNWSGGSCPSWSINVGFGSQDLSVPCYIWDVLGIIFIVSALFAARKIIFGG